MNGSASRNDAALVLPTDLRPKLAALLADLGKTIVRKEAQVQHKGGDGLDLVTSIDFAIQAQLEVELPKLLPGSQVTGEENYGALSEGSGPTWLVDPLDGTVNFVAGLPTYAIAVVLLIDDETVLAAVHDIPRSVTYSAQRDAGAFLDDAPLVRRESPARLCALSSGLLRDLASNAPQVLSGLLGDWKLRNLGSQALQLCHAAEGHPKFVASREARAWDDLAGALIATETGLRYGRYGAGAPPEADQPQSSLCADPAEFTNLAELLSASLSCSVSQSN